MLEKKGKEEQGFEEEDGNEKDIHSDHNRDPIKIASARKEGYSGAERRSLCKPLRAKRQKPPTTTATSH